MKLLIIVPAYNESENIVRVIEELQETVPGYDYVVVNDGSVDTTAQLCREHGYPLIDLRVNLGLTGALQTGMRYAWEEGYDAAIQIDADGQHDPKYIPEMAEKMEKNRDDIVIGSRFLEGKRQLTPRTAGNALLDWAIRLTTGKKVTDSTSGMRMYGKSLLRVMGFNINSSPEPDTLAYLLRCGARVEESPVVMRERTAGESYLNPWRSVRYMAHMLSSILIFQWFRRKGDANVHNG